MTKPSIDPRGPVIDVDRHVQETWSIFSTYAEPAFRDHVYRKVTLGDGSVRIAVGERVTAFSAAMWDDPYANRMFDDDRFTPNLGLREGLDPPGYLATMDAEGIDVAYLTPTLALGNYTIPNGAIGSAMSRAYGRWVREFCAIAPGRLRPVYPLNLFDVAQAVQDARWAVEQQGAAGLMLVALPVGTTPLHAAAFDPVWAVACELDVPVMIHSISSLPDREGRGPLVEVVAGAQRFGGALLLQHLVSHVVEQELAIASLVGGGVLARFPQLRLVFVEAGGGWLRRWIEEMDARFDLPKLRASVPWLTARPSEYFARQCLVAFHASEPIAASLGGWLGADQVVWASDFPHHDCSFPDAAAAVRRDVAGLPPPDQDKILGGNASRWWRGIAGA